jgi:hypothetical protein
MSIPGVKHGAGPGGKFVQNVNNCRVNETYGEISWNHMFQHPGNYTLAQSE